MMFFGNKSETTMVPDSDAQLITEAALIEGLSPEDAAGVLEDKQLLDELKTNEIVTERTIVKFDKKARLNTAYKTAIFTVARRRKDAKFKKLLTLWRMERQIEAYLMKKYHSEAMKIAKESLKRKKLPSGSGQHAGAVRKAIATAKSQLQAHK